MSMTLGKIEEGLAAGTYDGETLSRWFVSLERTIDTTLDDDSGGAVDHAMDLRTRVMEAMSATLPAERIALRRVVSIQDPALACREWIDRLRRERTYRDRPLVVRGLPGSTLAVLDGRHRFMAAWEERETHLLAVFVARSR